jgi:MFS family permease
LDYSQAGALPFFPRGTGILNRTICSGKEILIITFIRSRIFYGYIIVAMAFIILMLMLGLQGSFGLFFKPLTDDLGWSRTAISGAYSLGQIVYGICGIIIGGLNDRFGPRLSVTLCGVSAGLGCMLMSQVNSMWQIYLFYGVLFGIGNAIFVPLLSTIAMWFVKRRSMMSGIAFAGAGFGMLIMPSIISRFISMWDWRVSFIIVGIAILVISVLAVLLLRGRPEEVGQIAYGADHKVKEASRSENHPAKQSLTLKEVLRTPSLWLMGTALVCFGFSFVSLQVHIVPYATDIGISGTTAAIILTVMGGATIVGQIGLGSIGDRIGYKQVYLIAFAIITLGIIAVIFSGELWAFILLAVFAGMAFGDYGANSSPTTAWLFGLNSHGLVLGILTFCFTVGAAIGPLVFGYLYDATGGYRSALWVSAGLAAAAFIFMFFLKRKTNLRDQS